MKTAIAESKPKRPSVAVHKACNCRAKAGSRIASPAKPTYAPKAERVRFDWFFPKARHVAVAGSFNNWHPTATPLKHCAHGRWLLDIPLKPGRYEFRFVIDGQVLDHPAVTRRLLIVN